MIPYSVLTTGGKVGDGKRLVCMGRSKRAAPTPTHNGNQERVRAAATGRTADEIASATGIDQQDVRTALRRLIDAREVKRSKGDGCTRYTAASPVPLLTDLWK